MKKIISLLLCAVMCCVMLVGCVDDEIGSDLEEYEQYRKGEDRSAIVLDFYIVSETTDASAKETVTREINAYLSSLYKTTLDIHFITPDEYKNTINTDSAAAGDARADIVLVTDKAMFDELYGAKKLVALDRYFQSKDFGRLNSPEMIATALLDASVADDGNKYVVPNNRVAGEYGYYLVNKDVARYFCISELDFKQMRYDPAAAPAEGEEASAEYIAYQKYVDFRASFEALVEANRDALIAAGLNPDTAWLSTDADEVAERKIGSDYYDRLEYLDEYACIAGLPYVSAEEAHAGSFAIIAQDSTAAADHAYRCMEVIYALDTDATFKNLLQYGVRNTHYVEEEIYIDESGNILGVDEGGKFTADGKTFVVNNDGRIYELGENGEVADDAVSLGKAKKVIRVSTLDATYRMNMLHTGSIFNAHYNNFAEDNANVWNALLENAAKIQNKEAQVK